MKGFMRFGLVVAIAILIALPTYGKSNPACDAPTGVLATTDCDNLDASWTAPNCPNVDNPISKYAVEVTVDYSLNDDCSTQDLSQTFSYTTDGATPSISIPLSDFTLLGYFQCSWHVKVKALTTKSGGSNRSQNSFFSALVLATGGCF